MHLHSGDWLHALSISSCGLRLDDKVLRIATVSVLDPIYVILMNAPVARLSTARAHVVYSADVALVDRHVTVSSTTSFFVLSGAGITSIKEPAGLSLFNGKRPDGLTLTPGQAGKNANWNVTIPDTLAMSYLNSTSVTAGSAVEQASARKEKKKYAALASSHTFILIVIEKMGPIGSKASSFLQEFGRRLSVTTGNPQESAFLFQRLSFALQQYNAVCIRGTFGAVQENDSD